MNKLYFASDYQEGAYPEIMDRLLKTNMEHSEGYGLDEYCDAAKAKIRQACGYDDAGVYFLSGGTQVNETVIASALRPWEGVISAVTGHINSHEAGAVEYTGHKILPLAHHEGKLQAGEIEKFCSTFYKDANNDHMTAPGMVYISQPTEYGTLYSLDELKDIRKVCVKYDMLLFVDGARLGYALACRENDVSLRELADLSDVFYIGGTKCGALFGEAVVIPDPSLIRHFFTMIKQHGALLAKGRILGVQFDTLFTDDLYIRGAENAIAMAGLIRKTLKDKGYRIYIETYTNQIFVVIPDEKLSVLGENVVYGFWEKYDDNNTVIRLATSWATSREDVDRLIDLL